LDPGLQRRQRSLCWGYGAGIRLCEPFQPGFARACPQRLPRGLQPSRWFEKPHVILAVAVVCAETEEEAEYHARSMDLIAVRLARGQFGLFPTPEEAKAYPYTPADLAIVRERRSLLIVGDPQQVRERLLAVAQETGADELMISTMVHDPDARLRSYELVAEALR